MSLQASPWAARRVHHDLLDPLRVAQGSLSLLEGRHASHLPPPATDLLHLARASLDDAIGILDAARQAARPDAVPVPRVRVDVQGMLRELAAATLQAYPHVRVEFEPVPDVASDPVRLRRILQNLLVNAAKHAGPSPRVKVAGWREGDTVHVVVQDDGPGIDPRDHLFLFRHAPRRDGRGDGLPNVLDLVHELDGRLWMESGPGIGTSVHVLLR